MGYAIELFFDSVSESRVRSLWEKFAGFGAISMSEGARPHITLAVADSVDLPATHLLIDRFARAVAPFSLSLQSLGLFPSGERVAYLAPKVTQELLALHERFFEEFSSVANGVWHHYAPPEWVPHCTLAMGLAPQQLASAFDACMAFGLPLACTVIEIGLVEFRPIKQLHSAILGA